MSQTPLTHQDLAFLLDRWLLIHSVVFIRFQGSEMVNFRDFVYICYIWEQVYNYSSLVILEVSCSPVFLMPQITSTSFYLLIDYLCLPRESWWHRPGVPFGTLKGLPLVKKRCLLCSLLMGGSTEFLKGIYFLSHFSLIIYVSIDQDEHVYVVATSWNLVQ